MEKPTYEIINGDALEVLKTFPAGAVDFVLADLPYQQTAADWDVMIEPAALWKELKRIVKKNSAVCLFASQPFTSLLTCSNLKNFKHEYIWWKNRTSNFLTAKVQPLKAHESVLVFSFGSCPYYPQKSQGHNPNNFARRKANSSSAYGDHKASLNNYGATDRYPTSILMFNSVDNCSRERFHQNQKPVDLLRYLIRSYTVAGETVLDLTAGSFSTGVASLIEQRNFIGIDIRAENCLIGEARLKWASGIPADAPVRNADFKELPLFAA